MSDLALDLLQEIQRRLAPRDDDNRFVPLVTRGRAPKAALAALGVEELAIIDIDRRAFLFLAARSTHPAGIEFYTNLSQGETIALSKLPAYIAACGWGPDDIANYQPRSGCRTYPGYGSLLALNGDPVAVSLAMLANFAAFGRYCSAMAAALRARYDFDDEACGFFDFFATDTPELQALGLASVRDALAEGRDLGKAFEYARLLQDYELEFWNTLAEIKR